jgi:spore maturation protein CgeB
MLSLLGKILNRPHKLKIKHVRPEDIDLVFVSDPVVCRIDLRKYKNAVKAYWSQDCIYQSTFYTQLLSTKIQDYDIIFCAHKPYLEHFKEFGVKTYWLPFAYDSDVCRPIDIPEKYDITFVGTLTENRKRLLMKVKERFPYLKTFFGTAFQHNMVYIYNQSKVVLNISRTGELNWRVFEVLGCRRALLTDKNHEVSEVFNDGEHLMTYSSLDELFDKLETLLKEEDTRLRIASTGYLEVSKKHTIYHRAKEVLRVCEVG